MPPAATIAATFRDRAIAPATIRARGALAGTGNVLPGLALAGGLAGAALGLHALPGVSALSPMILAMLLGIAVRNTVGVSGTLQPGMTFALKRVLRLAIMLLGLRLTLGQIAEVGFTGFSIIAVTLVSTFAVTTWAGRLMGVDDKLTQLIAAGTSICGASAVIATNTVTRGPDEDVAYAVACVTVFGSIAMVVYPLLPGLLGLGPHAFGLWAGASIHEIAQVVAAAFQDGDAAGKFATVAKLSRVMLLAPVVMTLGVMAVRRAKAAAGDAEARAPIPWFLFGFLALVGLNSAIDVPAPAADSIAAFTTVLLTVSLAAMGLETDVAKLKAKGLRPALLATIAAIFIGAFSLMLIKCAL